jgi:hypothetical protein
MTVELGGSRPGSGQVTNVPTTPKTVGMCQSIAAGHIQDEEKQSEGDELAESPTERIKSVKTLLDTAKTGGRHTEGTKSEQLTVGMSSDNRMEAGLGHSLW